MGKLEYRKMSEDEVQQELTALQGWALSDGQITREIKFDAYKDGVVFAVAVAHLADRLNHHPDIHLGYAKVRVSVNTHDVGGLSPYDFELARQIETII